MVTSVPQPGATPAPSAEVYLDYTNYRGERTWRHVTPQQIWYGRSAYHGEAWHLRAWDFDKNAYRDFAVRDVHAWRPAEHGVPAGYGVDTTMPIAVAA